MPTEKRKFGDAGEAAAEEFLLKSGYTIIERNFRIKNIGEIDIVAEKRRKLFFFEVKTRSVKRETSFPIETSINKKKRRNLKKICQLYLLQKQHSIDQKWQVDALFIKVDPNTKEMQIEHLENILWEAYY